MSPRHEYEALLTDNLPMIEEVVRIVGRRRGFDPDEIEELAGTVRLRLVEDDYHVLRSFRGGASLRTYLVTVIQRMAVDFLVTRHGRWHASAAARRLGAAAVRLEELLVRERRSPEEAADDVCRRFGLDREAADRLSRQLPVRFRPRRVALEIPEVEAVTVTDTPESQLAATEARSLGASLIGERLAEVVQGLPAADRLLLKLRYESSLRIAQIAPMLGVPPKRLYKRMEWIVHALRRAVAGESLPLDGPIDLTREIAALWAEDSDDSEPGIPQTRQSHPAGAGDPTRNPGGERR